LQSKLKLYFDTSVISAYFDSQKPQRQLITQKWFESEFDNYECYISDLVEAEINATKNSDKRSSMVEFVNQYKFSKFKMNEEAFALSILYRQTSDILKNEINDTIHIAVATLNNIDVIVSWNFKHIVNVQSLIDIHNINDKMDLKIIEIVTIDSIGDKNNE